MTKIIMGVLIAVTALFSEVQNEWATQDFLKKDIKIIDIRTPSEWKETGTIKGSYTIMFFDEQGKFNVPVFLENLNKVVKKNEQFALICRVGSRTSEVSRYLSQELGYRVINLKGGIMKLISEGYKPIPYKE